MNKLFFSTLLLLSVCALQAEQPEDAQPLLQGIEKSDERQAKDATAECLCDQAECKSEKIECETDQAERKFVELKVVVASVATPKADEDEEITRARPESLNDFNKALTELNSSDEAQIALVSAGNTTSEELCKTLPETSVIAQAVLLGPDGEKGGLKIGTEENFINFNLTPEINAEGQFDLKVAVLPLGEESDQSVSYKGISAGECIAFIGTPNKTESVEPQTNFVMFISPREISEKEAVESIKRYREQQAATEEAARIAAEATTAEEATEVVAEEAITSEDTEEAAAEVIAEDAVAPEAVEAVTSEDTENTEEAASETVTEAITEEAPVSETTEETTTE